MVNCPLVCRPHWQSIERECIRTFQIVGFVTAALHASVPFLDAGRVGFDGIAVESVLQHGRVLSGRTTTRWFLEYLVGSQQDFVRPLVFVGCVTCAGGGQIIVYFSLPETALVLTKWLR